MSFTPAGGGAHRAFELVRQSLLQSDGLPFADALTSAQMQQAFDAEGVSFGGADRHASAGPADDDGIVYTPAVTLWAMLSQALFTDIQRACVAAVQRVAVYCALCGREVSSTNTGGYCRALAKVTAGVVRRLAEGVASRCEAAVPDEWRWHGFRTLVIDGTTFSMPDTEHNQEEYPQPASQSEGLGFPLMRAVALTSLVTGMVLALATGPYAGKETGETALFRTPVRQTLPRRSGAVRPILRRLVHAGAAAGAGRRVRDAAASIPHGRLPPGEAAGPARPSRRVGQAAEARVA